MTAVMLPCEFANLRHAEILRQAAGAILRDLGQAAPGGFGRVVFVSASVFTGSH